MQNELIFLINFKFGLIFKNGLFKSSHSQEAGHGSVKKQLRVNQLDFTSRNNILLKDQNVLKNKNGCFKKFKQRLIQ